MRMAGAEASEIWMVTRPCAFAVTTPSEPDAFETLAMPGFDDAQVLAWAESGKIRPRVSHVFPLAAWREAMLARWRGDVLGGCVLHP